MGYINILLDWHKNWLLQNTNKQLAELMLQHGTPDREEIKPEDLSRCLEMTSPANLNPNQK
jgi:hypothetical protein